MATNSSSPALLDPIHRWLRHVDEQISPGESVEFLKLPLYPFLRVEYAVAEKLKTPRKIYNFLLEKRFQHDKEKALYWFAHALSLLGGDLRGDYLVGDKCLHDYGISLPAAAPSHQMTPELQFFECITKIARKARGYNLEEGLKDRFARKRFLNVHPNHLKHLPDLFVRLVQRQIIGLTNTYYLHKALVKLGSRRAMQCLICLNEYHKSVGLDEIEEVKGVKKDPLTTAFENSCTASSDIGTAVSPRSVQKASKGYNYYKYHRHGIARDVGRPVPGQGDMDESLKTLDLSQVESEVTSTTDSEASDSSEDQSDSSPIARQHRPDHDSSAVHRKRTVLCCCLVWVIAIAVALTPSVGLGSTVWRKGLINTQKPDDVIVYNNSAVVITELDPYYHKQIKLTPMIGIPLRDSVVGIYRFNSSCDRLPTKNNMIRWRKVNVSGNQNYTHLYLLPPSTLNYTISPVDRNPARVVLDTDTRLDGRLEKVKGYIYITHGPESQGFDPAKCHTASDCDIVVNHPFTYNQHSNSYTVDSRARGDYYNFHSAYVVSDYRYTLDLIINATTVDLVQGQRVCNISDVNQGEGTCIDHKLGFKFQANSPVCLVAHMEYYEGNSYIILNVEVTKQLTGILLTSVLPAAVVLLLTFVCLISCTVIKFCCHCCKRQNQYDVVPVNVAT